MNRDKRKAFTIVELVIVIAVIAILAAVLIPTFSTVIKKAKESHFLQNKRNDSLNDFIDSMLDEDYDSAKEELVEAVGDDKKIINEIEDDLSSLFTYLLCSNEIYKTSNGTYDIDMEGIDDNFFDVTPEYSYVGNFGAGIVKEIYSYEDRYIILYYYPYGTSNFEIFLYDDVIIRDNPNVEGWTEITKGEVYYKLKIQEKDDSKTEYEIKVEQYVRSQS